MATRKRCIKSGNKILNVHVTALGFACSILAACGGGGDGGSTANGTAGTTQTGGSSATGGTASGGSAGQASSTAGSAGEVTTPGGSGGAGGDSAGSGGLGGTPGGAGAAGAGGTPETWSPSKLKDAGINVVLWLDNASAMAPGDGGIGSMSEWSDKSGKNHPAQQKVAAYQPSQSLSGDPLPKRVQFSSGTRFLHIADHADLQWGTGPFTVVAVARHTGDTEQQTLFAKYNFDANYHGPALMLRKTGVVGQIGKGHESTVTGDFRNKVHVYGLRRTTKNLDLRVDTVGYTLSLSASIDVSAKDEAATIGARNLIAHPEAKDDALALSGDVFEVIAVKGEIGDDNLNKLESYLMTKYAVSK